MQSYVAYRMIAMGIAPPLAAENFNFLIDI
jgi:hypothetical protein